MKVTRTIVIEGPTEWVLTTLDKSAVRPDKPLIIDDRSKISEPTREYDLNA